MYGAKLRKLGHKDAVMTLPEADCLLWESNIVSLWMSFHFVGSPSIHVLLSTIFLIRVIESAGLHLGHTHNSLTPAMWMFLDDGIKGKETFPTHEEILLAVLNLQVWVWSFNILLT